jgi:hypothetical protein
MADLRSGKGGALSEPRPQAQYSGPVRPTGGQPRVDVQSDKAAASSRSLASAPLPSPAEALSQFDSQARGGSRQLPARCTRPPQGWHPGTTHTPRRCQAGQKRAGPAEGARPAQRWQRSGLEPSIASKQLPIPPPTPYPHPPAATPHAALPPPRPHAAMPGGFAAVRTPLPGTIAGTHLSSTTSNRRPR